MAIVGRIARILLFLLLVVVVFTAGAVSVLTLTEKGRERLATAISDFASTDDARVRLSGLSGIWSGRLRLESLVLEDRQGAWLTARAPVRTQASLQWLARAGRVRSVPSKRSGCCGPRFARLSRSWARTCAPTRRSR